MIYKITRMAILLFCVLAFASGLAGMGSAARAQGTVATQSATAVSYQMPIGSTVAANDVGPIKAYRPLIPGGNTALEQIKRQSGATIESQVPVPQAQRSARNAQTASVTTSCQTNSANGYAPSDNHGAAGLTNLVVVTNVVVGVYNKSNCSTISSVTLKTFFNGFTISANETLFDPRVVYDRDQDRFAIIAESENNTNTDQYQYLAVSQDNTGTSWYQYRIKLSEVSSSTVFCKVAANSFWDYPSIGGMHGNGNGRIFIVANDFPSGGGTYGAILSINSGPALSGGAITIRCFNGLTFNIAPPAVHDTTETVGYFLSPGSGSGSSITRYALTPSSSGPGSDTLTTTSAIAVTSWTAGPNAPQPNGTTLDSLDGRFQSMSHQRGTSIWNVHAVNAGGYVRWRLYQFSTTGTSPLFTFTPTTADFANVDHLFNPSVRVNGSGTAFVTSSRTVPTGSTAGYAAMLIFQGSSTSSSGWTYNLIATSTTQYSGSDCSGACRWGDYSATQIDPSDNTMAWGFNQLITGTSQFSWTTRAALVGTTSVGAGLLAVSPITPLNLHGPVGGPFASDMPGQFTLTNTGSAALNYSISPPNWMSVSQSSSGSLAAGASVGVMVFPGPSALGASAGNYSSSIIFNNTTNGSGNTSVVTNLLVNQRPGRSMDPNDNGRSDPSPDQVAGTNRPSPPIASQ